MNAWLRHPLRVTARLLWVAAELVLAAASYAGRCGFRSAATLPAARAAWLQGSSRRILRVLRVTTHVAGEIPTHGLLVCNHLSYLDILVLAACAPAAFVSKQEVKTWPVFGWFARLAGTVFVNRERSTQVGELTREIESVMNDGVLVVLFPEGTSSGGQTLLPFKSALLEPVTRQNHPLWVGLIQYELDDGDVSEEVCYWRDMTLVPHLVNLLGKRTVRAAVRFSRFHAGGKDRKQLARELHAEVLRLKALPTRASAPALVASD